jgi:hypothetical protein
MSSDVTRMTGTLVADEFVAANLVAAVELVDSHGDTWLVLIIQSRASLCRRLAEAVDLVLEVLSLD